MFFHKDIKNIQSVNNVDRMEAVARIVPDSEQEWISCKQLND